jgi:CelD/BcsL family acetyltransferase involved in cellulose biosynthesis
MTPRKLQWQSLPARGFFADAAQCIAWDSLNQQHGQLPILSSYAVAAALEVFGQGDEQLFVARDVDTTVAMFVLRRAGRGRWHTFQPSQLPLGVWVARPDWPLHVLTQSLLQGPLKLSLALSITQIDPQLSARVPDGAAQHSSDYIETGWIDIQGDFETYWAARGKNLRSNMRKQHNKLAAEGVRVEMVEHASVEAMAPALARYGALESAGWKAKDGTAIHPDSAQGRFYRALLEAAAQRGEARVYELLFDGRMVASNLCVCRDGVLVVLKTTFDESIDKALSPAFLLQQRELEAVFAGGEFKRLEYFGRFMEWHSRWTDSKRALHHLTHYRFAWLKQLAQRRRKAHEAAAAAAVPAAPSAQAESA